MNAMQWFLGVGLVLGAASLRADEATPPATSMTVRGELKLSDDFAQPLSADWKSTKGKWEIVDGALQGTELAADKHGAVVRRAVPFDNAVVQYSFRLDGAKSTTLSVNMAKGHLCRLLITPAGFTVQKDDADHAGPDKAAVLQKVAVKIEPGVWHTVVVELLGNEMLASLDGQHVAFGSHDALKAPKANVGLTVAGESVSFKNFRVWDATPNPNWEATKAKLAAERSATAARTK